MLSRKNKPHKFRRSSLRKNKKSITMIRRKRKNFRNKKTKRKLRKSKRIMKGGDKTLSNILKINFDPPQDNLINLETDLYNIKHSPINNYMRTPGLNVGQPNNAPYTGFGWYQ